jgi:hypothetical protein
MTVYSRLVKLRVPLDYSRKFKLRKRGTNVIWYPYEHDVGERFAQLVTTNQHPRADIAGIKRDLDDELNYMPVCQDAVKQQKNTPTGSLYNVTALAGHPGLTGSRDFLKSRMRNVSCQWVSKEKLISINNKLKSFGYKKGVEIEEVKHHPTKPITLYKIKVGDVESG